MTDGTVAPEARDGNVFNMAIYRDEGGLATRVVSFLTLARHDVDLNPFSSQVERDIVTWVCTQGHPRGTWTALGGMTIRQSLQERLGLSKSQVSRAVKRMLEAKLCWIDTNQRGQERIRVLTAETVELVKEVEFRVMMAKDERPDDLAKIVANIGWDITSHRLKAVFADEDLDLDKDRSQDRRRAWTELKERGPKAWRAQR